MNKITNYFQQAYDELMNKVTWPSWPELQDSAVVVLITAVMISLVVLSMDMIFKNGMTALYKMIIGS